MPLPNIFSELSLQTSVFSSLVNLQNSTAVDQSALTLYKVCRCF